MRKFLIINPFGIGDVLFTTPLIKAIKDSIPDSQISYWCNERVAEVFKQDPAINNVFALSRGDLKKYFDVSKIKGINKLVHLLFVVRRERFDVVFDFSLDQRYGLISKLSGIKQRIGYNYKHRGKFLTQRVDLKGFNSRHIVEYYLELLKFVGIIPKEKKLSLFISSENIEKARKLLRQSGVEEQDLVVGLAVGGGASWGKDALFKHWPAEKFAKLADRLRKELNAKIILIGDDKETPIAQSIINLMQGSAINLTGKTNLCDLLGLISNLNILVANDGGPLHIGVAAGIKTVSVFGPVDSLVYGPYPPDANHVVIKTNLSCRPCYNNFRFPGCVNNRKCIEDITVEEVYGAVKKLI